MKEGNERRKAQQNASHHTRQRRVTTDISRVNPVVEKNNFNLMWLATKHLECERKPGLNPTHGYL